MRPSLPATLSLLLAVTLSSAARADVLVVDSAGGPGSDHASLFQAVAAAHDGDVLLVRPGNYDVSNTVNARSLTLVGDGPGVHVTGLLTVRDLGSDQRVVLRGITLAYPGALELYANDGTVFVESCTVLADQEGGAGTHAGILAEASRLVVSDSVVVGSLDYAFHGTPPTPGIRALGSEVVLTHSEIRGGPGNDPYAASVAGAAGLWLENSTARAQGTLIIGGFGDTAAGGTGLVALDGSTLRLLESSVGGGDGAPAGAAQLLDGGSTVIPLPGVAHALPSTSPVREGGTFTATVQGAPGDQVWLALSLTSGWLPAASGHSVLSVGAPFLLVPLGPLGPRGEVVLSALVPELGVQGIDILLQDLHVQAGGGLKLFGPVTVVTLLDGAY